MLTETWFAVVLGLTLSFCAATFWMLCTVTIVLARIEKILAADYGEED